MHKYFLRKGSETLNLFGRVIRMTCDIFWRIMFVLFLVLFFGNIVLFVGGICYLGILLISGKSGLI